MIKRNGISIEDIKTKRKKIVKETFDILNKGCYIHGGETIAIADHLKKAIDGTMYYISI